MPIQQKDRKKSRGRSEKEVGGEIVHMKCILSRFQTLQLGNSLVFPGHFVPIDEGMKQLELGFWQV